MILAEKGQYICNNCHSTIAEYREFRKQDEIKEIGEAKPLARTSQASRVESIQGRQEDLITSQDQAQVPVIPEEKTIQISPAGSISSIEGLAVYDENARKIGIAKQAGIDSNQTVVLLITKNDGTQGSVPWSSIGKVGDVILLGSISSAPLKQPGKCSSCGFLNNESSKFCEECGKKIQ